MKRRFLQFLSFLGFLTVVAVIALIGAFLGRYQIARSLLDLPAFTHSAGAVDDFSVTTPDGAVLVGDVYKPRGEGPWPTVLMRDPYGVFHHTCPVFVRYGYACVFQNTRGRNGSGGVYYPFLNERADGKTTLDWLVKQDFQDGNIAMWGVSYLGITQWAVADILPPEVKTLVIITAHPDIQQIAYSGGNFAHLIVSSWAAVSNDLDEDDALKAANARPGPSSTRDFGKHFNWYDDWVQHPWRGDNYWQQDHYLKLRESPEGTRVPVFVIGGWYDLFIPQQIDYFDRLGSKSRSRLLVHPVGHGGQAGDVEYPAHSFSLILNSSLAWIGHHTTGAELEHKNGVASYVLGEDRYAEYDEWPPPTRMKTLAIGEGRYVYDPADPVPSNGGSQVLADPTAGSHAQDDNCARHDVLCFEQESPAKKLHIAGSPEAVIEVASDAEDTSFLVRLVVDNHNVRESILSLSARDGPDEPADYTPGERVELHIVMAPIERVIEAGSTVRIEVTSSSFPIFHPHPNTTDPWFEATAVTANQTLYGGELRLPVVRR